MNKIKMVVQKLALLVVMVQPMVVMADVPHPTYVYRLRRIGYEVLPDYTSQMDYASQMFFAAAFAIGFAMLWFLRKNRWKKWVLITMSVFCGLYVVGVSFGRFFLNCFESLRFIGEWAHKYEMFYAGVIHSGQPGWKYEEFIAQHERDELKRRVMSIQDALQKLIDDEGVIVPYRPKYRSGGGYSYESRFSPTDKSREAALIRVLSLKKAHDVRSRCKGIPIEWLVGVLKWKDPVSLTSEVHLTSEVQIHANKFTTDANISKEL